MGIRIEVKVGKWPEHLKAARAGKLRVWGLGYAANAPDADSMLQLGYGPSKGQQNLSHFQNDEFDRLYRQQRLLPDGPERLALIQQAVKIMVAYMPYKFSTHRTLTDMTQPWLIGYRRHPVAREFWKYVDIDTAKLPR